MLFKRIRDRWRWRSSRSKNRRLTVVSQFFPPDFAATGQLLEDLTSRLSERGLQVQILSGMPAYAFNSAQAPSIDFSRNRYVRRTRVSRLWPESIRGRAVNGLLFCIRSFSSLLKNARRGDLIIYTTEPPYLPFFGALISLIFKTPFIVIVYDMYPDVLVNLKVLPSNHVIIKLWERLNIFVYNTASEIIVLSEPIADKIISENPQCSSKVSVIPSWADPSKLVPVNKDSNWFLQKYGLLDNFVILYSGNQGRCHDLMTIIISALLMKDDKRFKFVFIGAGAQNKLLKEYANEWSLSNVLFVPYQELENLRYSLSAASIAVVSLGTSAEGLVAPSKLYGHLSVGTPIAAITPKNSYLRELIEKYKCGRWFQNGDAVSFTEWIQYLYENKDELEKLSNNSRYYLVNHASAELVADNYFALINKHLKAKE